MNPESALAFAQKMDENDPLHHFRDKFFIPQRSGKDCIYLAGNSLGLQPKSVKQYIEQELDDWAKWGVEGHFHAKKPWVSYHEIFSQQLSAILGCLPAEVVAMNQLTVNLHLLMVSFYRPSKKRYKIICEAKAFPSDQYAFASQVRFHGFDPGASIIEVSPRQGEQLLREEDILSAIQKHGAETALVLFGGVNYYSGQLYNIKAITQAAQQVGAYAGFDLAHAIGNVELRLREWNVDFACWCSYKYLNSGPGGVAGIYIHEKHAQNKQLPRFEGWWGSAKETRFRMEKNFEPIPTAEAWQLSNAPVLSMAAHKAALGIFEEAGMERLVTKSKLLSAYLFYLLDEINATGLEKTIEIITPRNGNERGCQVSMLMIKRGREIFEALSRDGVVADWREPDVIRVAPVPLYNKFEDVWLFADAIKKKIH